MHERSNFLGYKACVLMIVAGCEQQGEKSCLHNGEYITRCLCVAAEIGNVPLALGSILTTSNEVKYFNQLLTFETV